MDTSLLSASIARASAFAATLYDGDVIDEDSGFTIDDLRALIAAVEPSPADPSDELADKLGDLA